MKSRESIDLQKIKNYVKKDWEELFEERAKALEEEHEKRMEALKKRAEEQKKNALSKFDEQAKKEIEDIENLNLPEDDKQELIRYAKEAIEESRDKIMSDNI